MSPCVHTFLTGAGVGEVFLGAGACFVDATTFSAAPPSLALGVDFDPPPPPKLNIPPNRDDEGAPLFPPAAGAASRRVAFDDDDAITGFGAGFSVAGFGAGFFETGFGAGFFEADFSAPSGAAAAMDFFNTPAGFGVALDAATTGFFTAGIGFAAALGAVATGFFIAGASFFATPAAGFFEEGAEAVTFEAATAAAFGFAVAFAFPAGGAGEILAAVEAAGKPMVGRVKAGADRFALGPGFFFMPTGITESKNLRNDSGAGRLKNSGNGMPRPSRIPRKLPSPLVSPTSVSMGQASCSLCWEAKDQSTRSEGARVGTMGTGFVASSTVHVVLYYRCTFVRC